MQVLYIVYVITEPEGVVVLEVFENKQDALAFEQPENLHKWLMHHFPAIVEKVVQDGKLAKGCIVGFSIRELHL